MTEATATAGALRHLSEEGVRARPDGLPRRRIASGGRWSAAAGARTGAAAEAEAGKGRRRPLGASTGVKHPAYRDTPYGDDPVAPGTADGRPEAMPETAAGHGAHPGGTVPWGPAGSAAGLASVQAPGISADEMVTRLADEGVAEFEAAWQDLLDAVAKSPTIKGVDAE
ncbi:hypothetical protein [Streptomyces achromogenes]|uniref:hypothetical protein n=1 Tax=Streptomyces achromogenes TaxID=67255 RepID=UPI0027D7B96C|nr:hypothetical protein [Streptomyces achromogenes]